MLVAETALIPKRSLNTLPGLGLGSWVQAIPFQCKIRVWSAPPLLSKPTAQTLHGDSIATASSSLSEVPGLGGCVPVQLSQEETALAGTPAPMSRPTDISGAAS